MSSNIMRRVPASIVSTVLLTLTLLVTSCGGDSGKNIQLPGLKGPNLNLFEDKVLISMVLEDAVVDGGIRYELGKSFPQYANSYVEVGPDFESGGTLIVFGISLQDVFHGGVEQLDPMTLPGGRPLPGIASGMLPAAAFTIKQWANMSLYLGPDVFGLFVPIKYGNDVPSAILTWRYYVGDKRVGNLSFVGPDNTGENSGVLLMLDLKGWIKDALNGVANKYN